VETYLEELDLAACPEHKGAVILTGDIGNNAVKKLGTDDVPYYLKHKPGQVTDIDSGNKVDENQMLQI